MNAPSQWPSRGEEDQQSGQSEQELIVEAGQSEPNSASEQALKEKRKGGGTPETEREPSPNVNNFRRKMFHRRRKLGLQSGQPFAPRELIQKKLLSGGYLPTEVREWNGISSGAKVLYSALMEWECTTKRAAYPSVQRLAETIAISPKQTRRYLQELKEAKLIHIEHRKTVGNPRLNDSNVYRFVYHPIFEGPAELRSPDTPEDESTDSMTVPPEESRPHSQKLPQGTPKNGSQSLPTNKTTQQYQGGGEATQKGKTNGSIAQQGITDEEHRLFDRWEKVFTGPKTHPSKSTANCGSRLRLVLHARASQSITWTTQSNSRFLMGAQFGRKCFLNLLRNLKSGSVIGSFQNASIVGTPGV